MVHTPLEDLKDCIGCIWLDSGCACKWESLTHWIACSKLQPKQQGRVDSFSLIPRHLQPSTLFLSPVFHFVEAKQTNRTYALRSNKQYTSHLNSIQMHPTPHAHFKQDPGNPALLINPRAAPLVPSSHTLPRLTQRIFSKTQLPPETLWRCQELRIPQHTLNLLEYTAHDVSSGERRLSF